MNRKTSPIHSGENNRYNPVEELLWAVVERAVIDLDSDSEIVRDNARSWLLSRDCFLPDGMGATLVRGHDEHDKNKTRH